MPWLNEVGPGDGTQNFCLFGFHFEVLLAVLRISLTWEQSAKIIILLYTFQRDRYCRYHLAWNPLTAKLISLFFKKSFTSQPPKLPHLHGYEPELCT